MYRGAKENPLGANDLLYNYTIERIGGIYGWFAQTTNVSVNDGDVGIYIGAWMDTAAGFWYIGRDTTVSGAFSLYKSEDHPGTIPAQAPDPLSGESESTSYAIQATIDYTAVNSTKTTFNQYYGDAENYIARRDLSGYFPSGVTRQIKITYPKTESMVNLTYSNGGLYDKKLVDSEYTQTSYNASYYLLTIPESSISLYGGQYRLYTSSKPYTYTFIGPFFENGTSLGTPVNITAHLLEDTEEFELNGSLVTGWDEQVILFSWILEGGGTRLYYPMENGETIYVYFPEDDYALYSFDVKDYSGKIGTQDTYLQASRYISSVDRVVQRILIENTFTDVPFLLVIGKAYTLKVYLPDGSVQSFGFFVAGASTNPVLIVRAISFSDQTQQSQKYIYFEASRSVDLTAIQGEYEDTREMTTRIEFEVRYSNNTVAYSDYELDTSEALFQWTMADNETDYYVYMKAVTPQPPIYLGNITYKWPLPCSGTAVTSPFDIGFAVGNTTIMASNQIIPMFLVLSIASTSSVVWAPFGIFITILFSAILTRMGWFSLDTTLLTAAMCFAVIFFISEIRRRVRT